MDEVVFQRTDGLEFFKVTGATFAFLLKEKQTKQNRIRKRKGMIFLSEEDSDIKRLIKSWVLAWPEAMQGKLEAWFDSYFFRALKLIHEVSDEAGTPQKRRKSIGTVGSASRKNALYTQQVSNQFDFASN